MGLGIIAGEGQLPIHLAELSAAAGEAPFICEMAGTSNQVPETYCRIPFRIERLGDLFDDLRAAGVTELVAAGAVTRPPFDPAALDDFTKGIASEYAEAAAYGDDRLLSLLARVMVEAGFDLKAPVQVAPELLPPPGVLTRAQPAEADRSDAARAANVLAAIGAVDIGQGCVVAAGLVLAVEALPGTDWMLASLTTPFDARPPGGVFMKAPKPGQDRRMDLPAIGPDTAARAVSLGLNGIVVEAGGVMVLDREGTVAALDEGGLFLWVREADACASS